MKFILLIVLVYLSATESGIILDRIKSAVDNTRQDVRCGVSAIGQLIHSNTNKNCQDKQTDEIGDKKILDKKNDTILETATSSRTDVVTVPEGKRLISVGANCPEGYRGDGKGNCREEY